MKFFLNFVPIFTFFIVYKLYDMFIASILLMISTILICVLIKLLFKKIEKIDYINCISVVFFGSLTLFFHNSIYIKWKVTIIYLCFSISFIINYLLVKKPLIRQLLEEKIKLTDCIWKQLDIVWSIFFLICAIMNLYIMLYASENMWMYFKVFGLTILTLCFALTNIIYIYFLLSKNK
ncbi:MAG: septation protein IspZ [Buchnera aphidicola (Meitanaphis elongallis)]